MVKFASNMLTLHDKLADLKSYFDGEKLDDESQLDKANLSLNMLEHKSGV